MPTQAKEFSVELRTLRYFLALTQEGTILAAARSLHITQPTLSRQLSELEKEIGKKLFERGSKRVKLTEEGVRLREYAKSIVALADKAMADLAQPERSVAGDVYIGCGESDAMRFVLRAAKACRTEHPAVRFHLYSGTTADLMDRFNDGLFDFVVEFEALERPDCNIVLLPTTDTWGLLTRKDSPLAALDEVRPADLAGHPVICSRQGIKSGKMREWAGEAYDSLDVVLTYNLVGNAALAVEEGIGSAICYDRLVRISAESPLCFRPMANPVASNVGVLWKRHRMLSTAAEAFLDCLKEACGVA